MALNECIPFYENGDTITVSVAGGVSGKTFAVISASRPYGPGFSLTSTDSGGGNLVCNTCPAGGIAFGVFANDQPTAEGKVAVLCGVGFVVPVVAGTAFNAGEECAVGAEGKAVKVTPNAAGVAAKGTLGVIASNNSVLITSDFLDSSGNAIKVVIEPLGVSGAFGIVQVGDEFKVTLKTSAGKVSEVTGAELITKLNANAGFKALAVASNNGASTGAGLAEPGEVQLTGGLDAGTARAAGLVVSACNQGEDAQVKLY